MPPISNLPPSEKGDIRHLRAIYGYLRPHGRMLLWAVVALVFTSAAMLGLGAALKYLVDEGLSEGRGGLLDKAFFIMLGVVALLSLASYARVMLMLRVGERVIADIRRDVFARVIAMDAPFFETTRTGELVSRLIGDTVLLHQSLVSSIPFAFRNGILALGGILMLFVTSMKLTAYVSLIMPLVLVPLLLIGRKVRKHTYRSQQKVAELGSHTEEVLFGIRTVKAFGLEHHHLDQFQRELVEIQSIAKQRINAKALLFALIFGLIFTAIITVLWIGGSQMLEGTLSGGQLSAFIFYAVIVASSLGALSEFYGELQQAAGAAERLMDLAALSPTIASPSRPVPLPSPVRGALRFDSVGFHYPARADREALSDFSLDVAPGETIALVGQSGAGKSTLFQLLLRFYDPTRGRILLDGIDIRALDLSVLRGQIGLVPQDPVIFSGNVWENIRCGRPEAPVKDIITAAEAASALEFIQAMPDGFDTYLGEKGVRLSGGQKQRIAIARAILRNPPILLLDEATSALDSENERNVKNAIEILMKNRTTLVIAHRLSTVMNAHRIIVLHQGKIAAIGTHESLLQTSPHYARLATLQFSQGV